MDGRSDSVVYRMRPDVVATVVGEGAVLLDLETKFFFSANQSAWAILQLFESGCTEQEALRQAAAWGAEPDEPGVRAFIESLIRERIVTPAADAEAPLDISAPTPWTAPTLEKHPEPLQRIMVSAFDPGLPLAE